MTIHASVRMQQRGIPPAIVQWLIEYGAKEYSGSACRRYFDKAARQRMCRDLGAQIVDRLGNLMNCYLIEGDRGQIITVAHRAGNHHNNRK
ncbi:MAG: hypothetical protein ACREYA_12970 [Cupriavidus necator]